MDVDEPKSAPGKRQRGVAAASSSAKRGRGGSTTARAQVPPPIELRPSSSFDSVAAAYAGEPNTSQPAAALDIAPEEGDAALSHRSHGTPRLETDPAAAGLEADGEESVVVEKSGWVACDLCGKWRKVPPSINLAELTSTSWTCRMNSWDAALAAAACSAAEESWEDAGDAESVTAEASAGAAPQQLVQESGSGGGMKKKQRTNSIGQTLAGLQQYPSDSGRGEGSSKLLPAAAPPTIGSAGRGTSSGLAGIAGGFDNSAAAATTTAKGGKKGKAAVAAGKRSAAAAAAAAKKEVQWVQCEKTSCMKWRMLPPDMGAEQLPSTAWYCSLNFWYPLRASCDVAEDSVNDTSWLTESVALEAAAAVQAANASLSSQQQQSLSTGKSTSASSAAALITMTDDANFNFNEGGGGGGDLSLSMLDAGDDSSSLSLVRYASSSSGAPPAVYTSGGTGGASYPSDSLGGTQQQQGGPAGSSSASGGGGGEWGNYPESASPFHYVEGGPVSSSSASSSSSSSSSFASGRASGGMGAGGGAPHLPPGSSAMGGSAASSSGAGEGAPGGAATVKKKKRSAAALLLAEANAAVGGASGSSSRAGGASSHATAAARQRAKTAAAAAAPIIQWPTAGSVSLPLDRRGLAPPPYVHGHAEYHQMLLLHPPESWADPSAGGGVVRDAVHAGWSVASANGVGLTAPLVGQQPKISFRDLVAISWGSKAKVPSANERSHAAVESGLRWTRSSLYAAAGAPATGAQDSTAAHAAAAAPGPAGGSGGGGGPGGLFLAGANRVTQNTTTATASGGPPHAWSAPLRPSLVGRTRAELAEFVRSRRITMTQCAAASSLLLCEQGLGVSGAAASAVGGGTPAATASPLQGSGTAPAPAAAAASSVASLGANASPQPQQQQNVLPSWIARRASSSTFSTAAAASSRAAAASLPSSSALVISASSQGLSAAAGSSSTTSSSSGGGGVLSPLLALAIALQALQSRRSTPMQPQPPFNAADGGSGSGAYASYTTDDGVAALSDDDMTALVFEAAGLPFLPPGGRVSDIDATTGRLGGGGAAAAAAVSAASSSTTTLPLAVPVSAMGESARSVALLCSSGAGGGGLLLRLSPPTLTPVAAAATAGAALSPAAAAAAGASEVLAESASSVARSALAVLTSGLDERARWSSGSAALQAATDSVRSALVAKEIGARLRALIEARTLSEQAAADRAADGDTASSSSSSSLSSSSSAAAGVEAGARIEGRGSGGISSAGDDGVMAITLDADAAEAAVDPSAAPLALGSSSTAAAATVTLQDTDPVAPAALTQAADSDSSTAPPPHTAAAAATAAGDTDPAAASTTAASADQESSSGSKATAGGSTADGSGGDSAAMDVDVGSSSSSIARGAASVAADESKQRSTPTVSRVSVDALISAATASAAALATAAASAPNPDSLIATIYGDLVALPLDELPLREGSYHREGEAGELSTSPYVSHVDVTLLLQGLLPTALACLGVADAAAALVQLESSGQGASADAAAGTRSTVSSFASPWISPGVLSQVVRFSVPQMMTLSQQQQQQLPDAGGDDDSIPLSPFLPEFGVLSATALLNVIVDSGFAQRSDAATSASFRLTPRGRAAMLASLRVLDGAEGRGSGLTSMSGTVGRSGASQPDDNGEWLSAVFSCNARRRQTQLQLEKQQQQQRKQRSLGSFLRAARVACVSEAASQVEVTPPRASFTGSETAAAAVTSTTSGGGDLGPPVHFSPSSSSSSIGRDAIIAKVSSDERPQQQWHAAAHCMLPLLVSKPWRLEMA